MLSTDTRRAGRLRQIGEAEYAMAVRYVADSAASRIRRESRGTDRERPTTLSPCQVMEN